MEPIGQLLKWQEQVKQVKRGAAADMDVAKRLLAHGIETSQENAKLREELEAVTKERDEALERIKVSQEQVPWCYGCTPPDKEVDEYLDITYSPTDRLENKGWKIAPLFAAPVIPPTEAELQSQLAAANSRIAVLDAANVQQAEIAMLSEELEIAKIQLKQSKESEECHAFNARAANNGYVEMDKRRIAAEQRAEDFMVELVQRDDTIISLRRQIAEYSQRTDLLRSQLAAANSRIAVLDAANVQQAEEIERLKVAKT